MKCKNIFFILLIFVPLVLMLSGVCFADDITDSKDDFLTQIHQGYITSAMQYGAIFVGYTINLFWWLVMLDILYHMIMLFKNGDTNLEQIVSMLFYRIIYAGFFNLLIIYGADIGSFIYETIVNDFAKQMIDAGVGATGWTKSMTAVSPTDFLDIGFAICFKMVEKAGFWSKTGLMTSLVAVLLIILFMLIIAEIMVAMIEYYLVCSIGYFTLAFGGFVHTQSIVWNYFKTLFAMSFKIMTIYAVTSISFGFIQAVAGTDAQQTKIVSDTESLLVLLAGTCLFAILARRVPERMTGIISGMISGAGGVSAGASSMIKNVMSAGAGAAVGAAVATGAAGAAVSSAVNLAKAQAATTGGGSGSSTGTGSVGSPQNMGNGSGVVSRTLKNLAGAAGATMLAKGLKGENTFANVGGTMANRMDATKQAGEAQAAVNGSGGYTPPSETDVTNVLKGAKNP